MTQPTSITSARRKKKAVTPAPMGRPSKATGSNIEKLCQAIRLGATHKLACQAAGVGESTFYAWMRSDDFAEFQALIAEAESDAALTHLATLNALTQSGDPAIMFKAATWILERRYPEQYGRQIVTSEHVGEQVVRVIFDNAWRGEPQIADVTPEQYVEGSVSGASVSDVASEGKPVIGVTFEGD